MAEHIFVYGTLKTGQVRESMWPRQALQIRSAWTLGQLFDLGPYPAMLPGDQRIAGQLWTFRTEDVPEVLQVLDRIEGTNQPGEDNEYDRRWIVANLQSGGIVQANAYFYARPAALRGLAPIPAELCWAGERYCVWPSGAHWLP